MTERFIGLMSGTSLDAIDVALVEFDSNYPKLIASHSQALPTELRDTLLSLNRSRAGEIKRMAIADVQWAQQAADAVNALLSQASLAANDVSAIGSHGQTIRHAPNDETPYTLQIGDPNTLAELTGITTVADFRRRDLAAGGQGAPLMPSFHNAMLRVSDETRVVVNIGGMANITVLPADPDEPVIGFDTGPGNVLMDAYIQNCLRKDYDEGGKWAASGTVNTDLLTRFLRDKFFKLPPPKSTGRELFNLRWLERHLKRLKKRLVRKHVQASLCELTAVSISEAIQKYAAEAKSIIICGGGVHNTALMFRLQCLLEHQQIRSSEDYGIDPDAMEAIGFAWLAQQTLAIQPGNLPSVTGATHPVVLGGIYPGAALG
ncbi:MAG: anhydro-N-acetylmuramic acid kinase [Sulfuriflexus sp.]|nr:anhydro-N-acetylmuramic acid kinase [Sulfuriflexus sp.]